VLSDEQLGTLLKAASVTIRTRIPSSLGLRPSNAELTAVLDRMATLAGRIQPPTAAVVEALDRCRDRDEHASRRLAELRRVLTEIDDPQELGAAAVYWVTVALRGLTDAYPMLERIDVDDAQGKGAAAVLHALDKFVPAANASNRASDEGTALIESLVRSTTERLHALPAGGQAGTENVAERPRFHRQWDEIRSLVQQADPQSALPFSVGRWLVDSLAALSTPETREQDRQLIASMMRDLKSWESRVRDAR
jgi:hypothetical protein